MVNGEYAWMAVAVAIINLLSLWDTVVIAIMNAGARIPDIVYHSRNRADDLLKYALHLKRI